MTQSPLLFLDVEKVTFSIASGSMLLVPAGSFCSANADSGSAPEDVGAIFSTAAVSLASGAERSGAARRVICQLHGGFCQRTVGVQVKLLLLLLLLESILVCLTLFIIKRKKAGRCLSSNIKSSYCILTNEQLDHEHRVIVGCLAEEV